MPAGFSRLLPIIGFTYGFQALAFVPHAIAKSDLFYDACGATGFLSAVGLSLYYPSLRNKFIGGSTAPLPSLGSFHARQLLLSGAVVLWAARLGSFLVNRIFKHGKDSRFDEIKTNPARFAVAWMAQATWITLAGLPVYLVNVLPSKALPPLGPRDYAGIALFAASFAIEAIADRQKTSWRKEKDEKKHEEKFITSGLWSWSRHPNYVGEVGIWTGIWLLSTTALSASLVPPYTLYMAAISPVFEYLLLNYVSGVPLLEKAGDKKFAGDLAWDDYKKRVPVFFPWGPRG